MPINQDTSAITTAAQSFMESYAATLLSLNSSNTADVAIKMASYYAVPLAFMANGSVVQMTDEPTILPTIKGALDKVASISELPIQVEGFDVKAAAEKSAVAWLHLKVGEVEGSNVYFIRMAEDGQLHFEGGIFDAEDFITSGLERLSSNVVE